MVDDEHGVPSDPAVLAERYADEARALAARFDARNETRHQSGRVEHLLAEDRWVDHLSLLALPSAPAPGPAEDPTGGVDPVGTDDGGSAAPAAPAAPPTGGPEPLPEPADVELDGLLDLVDDALRERRTDVARAASTASTSRRPEPDRTEKERGRVGDAALGAGRRGRAGRGGPRTRCATALIHFDAAGDELRLHRTRANARVCCWPARWTSTEATATADDALAWLVEHDEPRPARPAGPSSRSMLDRAYGSTRSGRTRPCARCSPRAAARSTRDEHVALLLAQEELARGRYAEAAGAAARALRSATRRAGAGRGGSVRTPAARSATPPARSRTGWRRSRAPRRSRTRPTTPALVLELAEDHLAADRASDGGGGGRGRAAARAAGRRRPAAVPARAAAAAARLQGARRAGAGARAGAGDRGGAG